MAHKFDIKNIHKLDNEKRRKILPPLEVLVDMGLREGDIMADIGCGIGYFTFPASQIVGKTGKVFAMDISKEMLEKVNKKAEENNISNILTVHTGENDLKIPAGTANFAFISNVLHEAEDKEKLINEANRILTNDGRIGIIEWQMVEGEFGPPLEHRLSEEYVKDLLLGVGLKNINIKSIGEYFYVISGTR
jgi:ubiquinone/menaquinone biosynthesis C-methylase UbiE